MLFEIGKRMLVDEEYKQYIVSEIEKLKNRASSREAQKESIKLLFLLEKRIN